MTLAELRKLSIRKQLKIRFQLANGLECVITEHGVAQIPALHRVPEFNLEQELRSISRFVLEPAVRETKAASQATSATREEIETLLAAGPKAAAVEHEDE